MTAPLVSVVTPSYNQSRFLEETIRSVLEHDYPAVEYLIVEDGSTDGSAEIVRRYADRLAWWTVQPTAGQSAALNRGFAHARGDYLGFLSGDDTLLPGALRRLVSALEREPDAVLAYGDGIYTNERSESIGYAHSREWDTRWVLETAKNPVVQQAALWSRRAWELAGPFDEGSGYYFDLELYLRLSVHGRFRRIPEPLATVRLHPASKSVSDAGLKARDAGRFADVVLTDPELPAPLRAYAGRGRSAMLLRSGMNYYAALDLPHARRQLLRAVVADPAVTSRRWALLTAKSLLPTPIVRRLRTRRVRGLGNV
jgi:glycosyltransferase involved in cell wall biosynthesis